MVDLESNWSMAACVVNANVAITTSSANLTAPATVVELLMIQMPPVLITGHKFFILRLMMINSHTLRQSTTCVWRF
jgi:hypothetical protein